MWGISWSAEELSASQEGLCSKEILGWLVTVFSRTILRWEIHGSETQDAGTNAIQQRRRPCTQNSLSDTASHAITTKFIVLSFSQRRLRETQNQQHPTRFQSTKTSMVNTKPRLAACLFRHRELFISTRLCVSGDRKFGLPQMDPFIVKELYVQQSGFSLIAQDLSVEGLKDADLQDIK
jgi:hypothetical protein